MKRREIRRSLQAVIAGGTVVLVSACAQIQGLDDYEKVDCLGDECDAGTVGETCPFPITVDPDHCGDCSTVCSSNHVTTRTCASGVCTSPCQPGFADCNDDRATDGCETDIATSPVTCGACDTPCSSNNVTPTCVDGACAGTCADGFDDCNTDLRTDGCETNVAADPMNCGGCGIVCSTNHVLVRECAAGVCVSECAPGYSDCNGDKLTDGCETSLADPDHCGTCDTRCSDEHVVSRSCNGTVCNGACETNFGDCNDDKATDGCETRLTNDTAHCNGCNKPCPSDKRRCSGGICSAGYGITRTTEAFIDACALPGMTRLMNSAEDEEWTGPRSMPFPFTFYGASRASYWIQVNGVLSFTAPPTLDPDEQWPGCPTPDPDYGAAVFPFGMDLVSRSGNDAGICVAVTGAAPTRRLVVTWKNMRDYDTRLGTFTFSLVLNEAGSTLDFLYGTLSSNPGDGDKGEQAIVGLQADGSLASQSSVYSCEEPHMRSGMALHVIPSD